MKRTYHIIVLLALPLFGLYCKEATVMIVKSKEGYFKASYKGKIRFDSAETSIENIVPDGYLKIWEDNKNLVATADGKGGIVYRLDNDGRSLSQSSEEGRTFTSGMLRDLIDNGFDAEERLQRIHTLGGQQAVLGEVSHIKIESVRGMYFRYVLKNDTLSTGDKKEIAASICRLMGCSTEKAPLLSDYASLFLQDPESAQAYLDAVKSICTSTERTNTLYAVLDQHLVADQLGQVLGIIGTIETDIERGALIDKILTRDSLSGSNFDQALDLVAGVDAEPDRTGLLIRFARQNSKTNEQWIHLIDKTEQLSPDIYRRQVLQEIARQMPASIPVNDRYQLALKALAASNP